MSNYTVLMDSKEPNDDFNMQDERDRRAIDEEDDEDFLQELYMLAQEVRREHGNVRFRYENDRSILSMFEQIYRILYI